jgi:hypothetical protein
MQGLPADILRYLASFLIAAEIVRLCRSGKFLKEVLYDSEMVWRDQIRRYLTEHPVRSQQLSLKQARRDLQHYYPFAGSWEPTETAGRGYEKLLPSPGVIEELNQNFYTASPSHVYILFGAAKSGHLDIIAKYLLANGGYLQGEVVEVAAKYSQLEVLKTYLHPDLLYNALKGAVSGSSDATLDYLCLRYEVGSVLIGRAIASDGLLIPKPNIMEKLLPLLNDEEQLELVKVIEGRKEFLASRLSTKYLLPERHIVCAEVCVRGWSANSNIQNRRTTGNSNTSKRIEDYVPALTQQKSQKIQQKLQQKAQRQRK